MREVICGECGMVIGVQYGHTLRHGFEDRECPGSVVMVAPTYGKG
jgi:hypothetical protein